MRPHAQRPDRLQSSDLRVTRLSTFQQRVEIERRAAPHTFGRFRREIGVPSVGRK